MKHILRLALNDYNSLADTTTKDKLAEISYFGYGSTGRGDSTWYAATQKAMWEQLGDYSAVKVMSGGNSTATYGDLASMTNITSTIDEQIASIMSDVASYEASLGTPNFVIKDWNGTSVGTSGKDASYDSGIVGKTYTVTDTAGVITSRIVKSNTFSNAVVNGNVITITLTKDDLNLDHSVAFKGSTYNRIGTRPFVCVSDDAQHMEVAGDPLPLSTGSITLNAIGVPTSIIKTDSNGTVVSGAKLTISPAPVTGENASWTTNGQPYAIGALLPDTTYTVTETEAPAGYVKCKPVNFTPTSEQNPYTFTLKNYRVAVNKVDPTGTPVVGSTMQVLSANGQTVLDSWTTDGTAHYVSNLVEDTSYILRETKAPAGYTRAVDQTFTPTAGQNVTITVVDTRISVNKTEPDGTPIVGSTMQVLSANGQTVLDSWTTDGTAHYVSNLVEGTNYILREAKAPAGYTKAVDQPFTATAGQNVNITVVDTIVTVKKQDILTGNTAGGNASLDGAKFAVYKDANADGALSAQEAAAGAVDAFTLTDHVKGYDVSNLVEGTNYILRETAAPEGYKLSDDISFAVSATEDQTLTVTDELLTGQFSIYKHWNKQVGSEWDDQPEEGAVFAAILTSNIKDQYAGDFTAAYNAIKNGTSSLNAREYAILTTGTDGTATSNKLVYGTYTIKQISGNPESEQLDDEATFKVTGKLVDGKPTDQDIQHYTATNDKKTYSIQFTKKDANTGKDVALTSAAFQLYYDANSNGSLDDSDKAVNQQIDTNTAIVNGLVTMTVGRKDYSTYVTHATDPLNPSNGFYFVPDAADADLAKALTPLTVQAGKYIVVETSTPAGYTTIQPFGIDVSANSISMTDKKTNYTKNFTDETVSNERVLGKLNVNKTVEAAANADLNLANTEDLSGIKFELRATEDIIDPADGSVITAKGSVAKTLTGTAGTETYDETGAFNLNADGTFSLDNIPLGSYELVETATIDGLVLNTETTPVVFTQQDNTTKTIEVTNDITNKETSTQLTKTTAAGSEELPGAKIELTDNESGTVVATWTSTEKAYVINGLTAGKTYTMTETIAPDGYYYSSSIDFKVNEDGTVNQVNMIDNLIHCQIAKVDDNGAYVKGVTLKLTDTTTNTAVTLPNNGITTDQPFDLAGKLIADHSYILEESEYVAGVYKATSMEFTIPHTGTSDITTITMKDALTNISVEKVDNHNKAVAGAKMSICEATVDEKGNAILKLVDGKPVEIYSFVSTDKATDISSHVKGGETYILHETEAPFGFDLCKDQAFTATGTSDKAQVIMAIDARRTYYVSAVKADAADNAKLLKGAEITLFNSDGTIAKDVNGNDCKATTDGTGLIIWHIEYAGDGTSKTDNYYVQETAAPEGYRINSNHFSVTLSNNTFDSAENAVKIIVNDEALPATGVTIAWGAGIGAVLAGIGFVFMSKKKKHADAE
jgi:LPXTG-motif cell wall-anchored protein